MKTLLIACDFDGTITTRDTLHVIVDEYGGRGVWDAMEPRIRAGELSVEDAMVAQFAEVRVTLDDALRTIRRLAPVRPGFVDLVAWAEAEGHRLVVFSNGFRVIIQAVLDDAGVGHLTVHSHDAVFGEDGCRVVWAPRGEICDLCDRPCKRHDLAGQRRGDNVVYVGDGLSDRCVALAADLLFARDSLARHLDEAGVGYVPFDDFHDVRDGIDRAYAQAA